MRIDERPRLAKGSIAAPWQSPGSATDPGSSNSAEVDASSRPSCPSRPPSRSSSRWSTGSSRATSSSRSSLAAFEDGVPSDQSRGVRGSRARRRRAADRGADARRWQVAGASPFARTTTGRRGGRGPDPEVGSRVDGLSGRPAYIEGAERRFDAWLDDFVPPADEPPRRLHAAMRHLLFPAASVCVRCSAWRRPRPWALRPECALPVAVAVELDPHLLAHPRRSPLHGRRRRAFGAACRPCTWPSTRRPPCWPAMPCRPWPSRPRLGRRPELPRCERGPSPLAAVERSGPRRPAPAHSSGGRSDDLGRAPEDRRSAARARVDSRAGSPRR